MNSYRIQPEFVFTNDQKTEKEQKHKEIMLNKIMKEAFSPKEEKKGAEKEISEEDSWIDQLEIDDELKEKLKKMGKYSLTRKYLGSIRDLTNLRNNYNQLLQEKWEWMEKEIRLAHTIEDLKKRHEPDTDNIDYNRNWTWLTKMEYVLKKCMRPMKSAEIIKMLLPYESALNCTSEPQKYLSGYLNKAVKYQRILTHKIPGVRGYFYVLPQWMENGKLLSEYENRIFIYK